MNAHGNQGVMVMVSAPLLELTVNSNGPEVRSPPIQPPLALNVAPCNGQRKPALVTARAARMGVGQLLTHAGVRA